MSTDKQTAANRANAQRSTGPQSAAGQTRSALNALKSGIYAESLLLPDEKLEDLRTLIAEYYLYHTPRTPAARNAVDNMIRAEWLSRRLASIDTQILTHEIKDVWKPDPGCTTGQGFNNCRVTMEKVQHRITATDNLYHRNLRVFQLLQPDLEPAPDPPESDSPQVTPDPDSSTVQPAETTTQTRQMGSFHKNTPILPTGHPVNIRDCPNCSFLGYHSPSCHYDLRKAS